MATRKVSVVRLASAGRNALFKGSCISPYQQLLPGMNACVRTLKTTTIRYKSQKENPSEESGLTLKFMRGASKMYKDADAAVRVVSEFFSLQCGKWP
jgi:hypothetical protein